MHRVSASLSFVLAFGVFMTLQPLRAQAQAWSFISSTPPSGGSVGSNGLVSGLGGGPNIGDQANFHFEVQPNYPTGVWDIEWKERVQCLAGPMGMVMWSQSLDPANSPAGSWTISPFDPGMPGTRFPDHRTRLFETGTVDIAYALITVTP